MFLQSEQQQQRQLVGIASYRHKFVLLLAKAGKIDQVMNVISTARSVELDKGVLTNTKPKGQFSCTFFALSVMINDLGMVITMSGSTEVIVPLLSEWINAKPAPCMKFVLTSEAVGSFQI